MKRDTDVVEHDGTSREKAYPSLSCNDDDNYHNNNDDDNRCQSIQVKSEEKRERER